MLEAVRRYARRVRHVVRPPRSSWSYRYQLMADQSGPVSAIPLLAVQEKRIRSHAQFEGVDDPHPLRGIDEETRTKARKQHRTTTEDGDSDD